MRLLAILYFIISSELFSQRLIQLDTLVLKNGLKIYLLSCENDSLLSVRLQIDGGKKNESRCQVGYSELIKELFRESIKDKHRSVEGPAKIKCDMVSGALVLSANCTMRTFEKEMQVFCNLVLKLRFKPDRIDKVTSASVDSYKPEKISTSEVLRVYSDFLLYGFKNPLGRDYCQYQVQKVIPGELREFYFTYYTPENTSLLVCGRFNRDSMEKIIKQHFNKWKTLRIDENPVRERDLLVPKIKNKEIIFVNKRTINACFLKWMQSAPAYKSPDYLTFLLANELFVSCMNGEIGLARNGDTLLIRSEYKDRFVEWTTVTSEKDMQKVMAFFERSLHRFHLVELSERDLEGLKERLGNKFRNMKSSEKILSFYNPLLYDVAGRVNFLADLNAISCPDIQKVVDAYFNPGAYKLIMIGKETAHVDSFIVSRRIPLYQATDFQACDEKCVPKKYRWKPHNEQPRLFCRDCWKLGRFWGKNRA